MREAQNCHAGENPVATYEYVLVGCLTFILPPADGLFAWNWSRNNPPGAECCLAWSWGWFGLNVLLIILGFLFGGR